MWSYRPSVLIPLAFLLAGCMAPAPNADGAAPGNAVHRGDRTNDVATRRISLPNTLPAMRTFSPIRTDRPIRSNSLIMGDFIDLTFQLESGRPLPVLTRFEGPISVTVSGHAPAQLKRDLDQLLTRLRNEAGINIRRGTGPSAGRIAVELIPKRTLQKYVPHAACFVTPNVSGWTDYLQNRRTARTDWTKMRQRKQMAVFIPSDVSPQEMRDCLHEEIAQALGPVNDLYRLENSVFNDDNFHTVLTGFDMLILRIFYAPELQSGLSQAEVARRLPAVLNRLNPSGGSGSARLSPITPTDWKQAIAVAMGRNKSLRSRQAAAQRAVSIARQKGWQDNRLAFSLYAMGRLDMRTDSHAALAAFREAENIYRDRAGTDLHAAHMGMQLAAYALSTGSADQAIATVNRHIPAVRQAQNAALLATLLMIKAEALDHKGLSSDAARVRLDSLGWARYGFGSNAQVGARLQEIAAIAPG
ncbi:hypothetical protein ALP8811_01446 [Aliiroseovarius pelagivivens]|uniref:ATP-dependent transcriptional regulator n=1 Tax=Aliiroseovarius pelagivivens TaxID=1639690 RepID=A0A2R8AK96_9RHOB|nr:DUF2927 domain-containing protein [Aliiroseovarius pelagivivens]SPF76441.1 hypothetical protein ALP8811_01446 [Aliiroseovarius pelagivivens]